MKKVSYIVVIVLILCLCSCSKEIEEKPVNVTSTVAEIIITSTTEAITEKTIETTTKIEVITTKSDTTTTSTSAKKPTRAKITTTKKVTTSQKQTTTKPITTRRETSTNGCANGNHSMGVGDIGKWFNNRDELQSYVSGIISQWRTKLANDEITLEEYNKNAPTGYAGWSCSNCGKWTGNFKYR